MVRTVLATLAGALVLAGCAFVNPERIVPGTPAAEVRQQLGAPTARYPAAAGVGERERELKTEDASVREEVSEIDQRALKLDGEMATLVQEREALAAQVAAADGVVADHFLWATPLAAADYRQRPPEDEVLYFVPLLAPLATSHSKSVWLGPAATPPGRS